MSWNLPLFLASQRRHARTRTRTPVSGTSLGYTKSGQSNEAGHCCFVPFRYEGCTGDIDHPRSWDIRPARALLSPPRRSHVISSNSRRHGRHSLIMRYRTTTSRLTSTRETDSPSSHKSSWPSYRSQHTLTRRSCNNGTRVRTYSLPDPAPISRANNHGRNQDPFPPPPPPPRSRFTPLHPRFRVLVIGAGTERRCRVTCTTPPPTNPYHMITS